VALVVQVEQPVVVAVVVATSVEVAVVVTGMVAAPTVEVAVVDRLTTIQVYSPALLTLKPLKPEMVW
jgi:hypothetical protein